MSHSVQTPAQPDALLTDPHFFEDPYPAYRTLREGAPIFWSEAWGGWVLTRYADVEAVLRNPRLFSSAGRVHYLLDQLPADVRAEAVLLSAHYRHGIAHSDPPAHTRLRALLTPWFTPRLLESLRPRIRTLAAQLVEEAAAQPQPDLMRDLAYPLPAIVILELLGAPAADTHLFRRWAVEINLLFAGGGRTTAEAMRTATAGLHEMRAYVGALIDERRRRPSDDLIGHLVHAGQEGDRLSDAELVSTVVTLFVAGHETTTHLLGNGLIALLRAPDQLALLRSRPELMAPAVEELLRYDAPVQRSWRIALEETEIHGQKIRRGQMLLVLIGAANHDPAVFADADRLLVERRDNRHLGFGMGIHFCLGAPLARIEVPEALHAVMRTFPHLELIEDSPLQWRHDVALRGVEALSVKAG